MTFYERFEALCNVRGLRPQSDEIINVAGVSSPAITGWKKGSAPKADVLIRLSKYFNVSVDYLLGNEERSATADLDSDLTEQEKTLLAVYRASSEEVKLRIIQAVMNVKDESEKTHRVYRAARSSDNAEPAIVTRSQEDIDKLRNAKAVTCDEDL